MNEELKTAINDNPNVKMLYLKYLGCLNAMCESYVRLAEEEEGEAIEAAIYDGAETVGAKVKRTFNRLELIFPNEEN